MLCLNAPTTGSWFHLSRISGHPSGDRTHRKCTATSHYGVSPTGCCSSSGCKSSNFPTQVSAALDALNTQLTLKTRRTRHATTLPDAPWRAITIDFTRKLDAQITLGLNEAKEIQESTKSFLGNKNLYGNLMVFLSEKCLICLDGGKGGKNCTADSL